MRIPWFRFVLTALIAAPAIADVTVVRSMQTDGFGGFGGSTRLITTWIAANKQRLETKGAGEPTMLEKMAGIDRPEITRLDKKLRWQLNQSKRTYQEYPLILPSEPASASSEPQNDQNSAAAKPTMKITKAGFKVTPLGKTKKVGDFACDGFQLRALMEMEDLETHKKSEMRMVETLWAAPEQGAVAKLKNEEAAYAQTYAKALGLTDTSQTELKALGTAMIAGLAGSGEKELAQALAGMFTEMKKVKGYPIETRVEWYSKGDETESAAAPESESVEIPSDAGDALSSIAGGFLKKKMEAKRPAPSADGRLMMGMTTIVKSISTSAIPGSTFEVPAGFKKVQ